MTNQIATPERSAESRNPNEVSGYDRPAALAAMILMTNLGAVTMLLTPALVGGYIGSGWIGQAEASTLTATELTGMSVAVVLTSLVLSRIDRRLFLATGLLFTALGHFSSALATAYPLLLASRAVAGIGVGITYAIAVAAVSRTRAPDRSFGLAITANQLTVTLILWILSWRSLGQGYSGAMYVLLVFTVLTGLGGWWFPRSSSEPASLAVNARMKPSSSRLASIIGLTGMFLFLIGIGGVWPFVGEIARAHGIGSDAVGYALAASGFGGIGGGLLVSLIGLRFGRTLPIIVGTLGLATAMLVLNAVSDRIGLSVCAISFMAFWIFCVPYYLGVLSTADSDGRLAVLSSAAMPFGLAAGQAISNALIAGRSNSVQVMVSSLFLLMALAMTLMSASMVRKVAGKRMSGI
ncbi:MFS transporter [Burkholderia sp. Bp9142]|uniref:MFS transporter n=1 Tax=Burkholderia sp. Bp9142 TaxID=2184573 RepID=UPI000F5A16AF|nr:MFS transporter [Burkholderia sp. Bp9142]RQR27560.1 MFS transporter [Burkholderia sp. Bp9142]